MQLERDDPAEPLRLQHRETVVGVVGQRRVDRPLHHRVDVQQSCEGLGRLVLLGNAQVERLQPSEEQEARMRVEHAAQHPVQVPHFLHQLLFPGHHASDHVVVASEVLGGGVDDDVGPQVERPLVDGRREGAVDAQDRAVLAADRGDGGDVDAAQRRVGRRFGEEHGRAFGDLALERIEVARGDDDILHTHLVDDCVEKLARPPVAVCGRNDAAVLGQEGHHHADRCVHPRRAREGVLGALKLHHFQLHCAHSRVPIAPVLVALVRPLVEVDQLLRVLKGVGSGLHEGHHDGVRALHVPRGAPGLAALHADGTHPVGEGSPPGGGHAQTCQS
mmetsp:Transcript_32882/g.81730  ORF Transcript_32882/g.81730 Transcript_32882/m.81730 type:complete len:332 (+) Transcript_32882:622-1617(+)